MLATRTGGAGLGAHALKASHGDERREQEQAIQQCQTQYRRLVDRLHAMYLDKLDRRIDNAFYDRMSAQWRVEQARPLREIERHLEERELDRAE